MDWPSRPQRRRAVGRSEKRLDTLPSLAARMQRDTTAVWVHLAFLLALCLLLVALHPRGALHTWCAIVAIRTIKM